MRSPVRQCGLATVELAIIGALVMTTLFAVLEVGRAFFVYNSLEEATRRGARMAAVCQINDPAIAEITVFNASGGGSSSSLIYDLTTANVNVQYLNNNGQTIANPAGNFDDIEFVRVGIQNFTHQMYIPFVQGLVGAFATPTFATTLPRESLGITRDGRQPC